jgi:outer membrane murein-binding lipoprotein Lpp
MTPGADVQAIDALQDWHNALCVHREEAMEALSSIALEIRRAFDWIDEEEKSWRREAKAAEDDVVRAKAELNQRRNPNYADRIPDTSVQEKELARAKHRLQYAEDQIDVCRKWSARLPKMISEEYDGAGRRLMNFLDVELATAIADLGARIDRLHAYLAVTPATVAPPAPTPEKPS